MNKLAKLSLGVAGGILGISVIASVASSGSDESSGMSEIPTPTKSSVSSEAPPKKEADKPKTMSWDDGSYVVGTGKDIAPGRYRSPGTDSGIIELCTVTTYDADGNINDIKVATKPDEATLITLRASDDVFETSGCKPFVAY